MESACGSSGASTSSAGTAIPSVTSASSWCECVGAPLAVQQLQPAGPEPRAGGADQAVASQQPDWQGPVERLHGAGPNEWAGARITTTTGRT